MNAIILAGGEGRRLRSIWDKSPKPMIPLLGKPVMERTLALLRHSGVTRVRAALRYMPGAITEYFGDGSAFGVELSYSLETKPLGTAGGVRACADFYGERDFLVLSGDAACDFDLRALMECHRRHKAAVTMALAQSDSPTGLGLVVADGRGRVRSFIEKPTWSRVVTDRVNTGIYAVSPRAMAFVPPHEPFDFAKDLFPRLLAAGETLMALPLEGYWCDVGTPRDYYRCNLDALDGRLRLFENRAGEADRTEKAAAPEKEEREPPRGVWAVLPCASRARLMRALTEKLMFEAGADFSDGLRLPEVRFSPEEKQSALRIEARSEKSLRDWLQLAQRLEQDI